MALIPYVSKTGPGFKMLAVQKVEMSQDVFFNSE